MNGRVVGLAALVALALVLSVALLSAGVPLDLPRFGWSEAPLVLSPIGSDALERAIAGDAGT